jgi:hypothetical protein
MEKVGTLKNSFNEQFVSYVDVYKKQVAQLEKTAEKNVKVEKELFENIEKLVQEGLK